MSRWRRSGLASQLRACELVNAAGPLDPTEASGLGQSAHLAHHQHLVYCRTKLGWAQAYVLSAGEPVGPRPPRKHPGPRPPPRRAQFPSLDQTEVSGLGQCAHLAHHKHLVEELVRLAAVVRHPRPSAGSPRFVSAVGFRAAAAPQSSARRCQDQSPSRQKIATLGAETCRGSGQ